MCLDVDIIALKYIPIGVIKIIITLIINSILLSYCFVKVKHTVYWTVEPNIFETEGPRVRASPASLRCVLEQDTFILA